MDDMLAWAQAYDDLGIFEAAEVIRRAAEIMPRVDWTGDDPEAQKLDPLENQFYAASKEAERRIATLIRTYPAGVMKGLAL